MRTIQRDVVAAMIFSADGKLLMARQNSKGGGVYIDCWHIPGGGVEEGETKEEAMLREIKEELSFDVSPYDMTRIDDGGKDTAEKTIKSTGERVLAEMKFSIYKIIIADKKSDQISIALDEELGEYGWFTLEEIKTVKLTPPSIVLFKKLGYI
jgi:8-oxo-dGTP pyrophosphatase MutT (NUDIX family)